MLPLMLSMALAFGASTMLSPIQPIANGGSPATKTKTLEYTFATINGQPYCDGLTLYQVSTEATGYHTGSCEGSPLPYAGGFQEKSSADIFTITTTDPNAPNYTEVFLICERAQQWYLFEMDTVDQIPFQQIADGYLLLGSPSQFRGAQRTSVLLRR